MSNNFSHETTYMGEPVRTAWASAKHNSDFICIETCSGFRATVVDPQGKRHLLIVNVDDHDLGVAVFDCLAASRIVSPLLQPKEDLALFDYQLVQDRYSERVSNLMTIYGYKNKRALFNNMKHCRIECREGAITIIPTCHAKLEAWSGDGISKEDYVVIPEHSEPSVVGAALKLAFSRCR